MNTPPLPQSRTDQQPLNDHRHRRLAVGCPGPAQGSAQPGGGNLTRTWGVPDSIASKIAGGLTDPGDYTDEIE